MNDEERQQFYKMYSVLAILLQRNDKTGALVQAELSNHGVNLGRCFQLSQVSQSGHEEEDAKPTPCIFCGGKYFHEKTCKLSTYRTTY